MDILSLFRQKTTQSQKEEKNDLELDEEKNENFIKNEVMREKRKLDRERRLLDLEILRQEHILRKMEMQEKIEDMREETELRRLERNARRQELLQQFEEDDDNDTDINGLFGSILQKALISGVNPTNNNQPIVNQPIQPKSNITQINEFYNTLSGIEKSQLKSVPVETIKEFIYKRIPNATESDINHALDLVKNGN